MTLLYSDEEFSRQCIYAAYSSRLNPFALHTGEYQVLKNSISDAQTIIYLNIRNAILRLWTRNPLVYVSRDEAVDIAKDRRYTNLASVAYEWLARGGYINFGCVDIPYPNLILPKGRPSQKTILVIGAGVSGLACMRQLHNIFRQFSDRWAERREKLPHVLILEARGRIGGRVYSLPLKDQQQGTLKHGMANTAELGAQIITGFESGNPLDAIVRGQLALEYHSLRDNMVMYDHDGSVINEERDAKIQKLFNDILEAASVHGWKPAQRAGNDSSRALIPLTQEQKPEHDARINNNGIAKINGYHSHMDTTLGALMDHLVTQYQKSITLTPLDLRLLNWHFANLEYANAVNVDQLSLGGWDQDGGNEFDGRHSEIIGGYSQVPRALWKYPYELDVHLHKVVKHISYENPAESKKRPVTVMCDDGDIYCADYVVSTLPLGVLQSGNISFKPPLPTPKTEAIGRLGFGVLNKVILVFDKVFWNVERDMFGLLNTAKDSQSLSQKEYASKRGLFYLFWNCVKTSGRPMLVALMAGDAARAAEYLEDHVLVEDATTKLAKIFQLASRPIPSEAIITRWQKDPFARGSYSYLGPKARPGDYEAVAAPAGNLFFAGEATCGTHPATVHGAYLSGLRAASEVTEAMIGPITMPTA